MAAAAPITPTTIPQDRIAPDSPELNSWDEKILNEVARSLANGLELHAWWDRASVTGDFEQKFPTALTINRPDESFAYFDHATVGGKRIPIMGDMQEMFYDNTKIPRDATPEARRASVEWTRDQLQEYIMHYYSRTSSSALPKYYEPGAPDPPAWLNPFGLCPRNETDREGFGQKQLYYKLLDGRVGKFPKDEQGTIIDLREIGTKYEWMVGDARMFGFQFSFIPLGEQFPYGELPLRETQLAVISKDFIVNKSNPWDSPDGIVGEFGYGLATLKIPYDTTIVGYGPGYFDQGFMTYTWRIMQTGAIRAHMAFCVNQPDVVLNPALNPLSYGVKVADALSFGMASNVLERLPRAVRGALTDPVFASIAVANVATLGWAARDLNFSQNGVMKLFLYYHYLVIYTLVANSVATWRQIPDWLDTAALPDWVVKGTGSPHHR